MDPLLTSSTMWPNVSVHDFKSSNVLTVVIMDTKYRTANASYNVENVVKYKTQEITKV